MVKEKLDSKKIIKEIEESSEDIRKFGVKKIGLFGSFLHRDNKRKNDIDILVSFDNYMELKFLLEKIFGKKVDLVIDKNLRPELNYIKKRQSMRDYKLYLRDIIEAIEREKLNIHHY